MDIIKDSKYSSPNIKEHVTLSSPITEMESKLIRKRASKDNENDSQEEEGRALSI
jgi:hypothetical protein